MSQRVVVTGLGVVSPLGNNHADFWAALLAGRNGIGLIDRFDTTGFETRIAGQVHDFQLPPQVGYKDARRMARFTQFAVAAAVEALAHARVEIAQHDPYQVGVTMGCGIGGLDIVEEQYQILKTKGPRRVSPLLIPMFIPNMAAGQVAIHTGVKGPNTCPVTACASAAHAIGDAYRILQRGEAEIMIAGGTEAAITPLSLAGFIAARTMSTRNDDPEHASRPFDRDRDGFVMGEGAGVLILETLASAERRGVPILAEMVGYGMTNDAHHITAPAPEGEGLGVAMARALSENNLALEQVGYINAHGTSTPLNDITETRAIRQVFGAHSEQLLVSSTKSMTGHLLGAAGGIEAVATVLSLAEQRVHPTRNLTHLDPGCELDCVPHTARAVELDVALSNSMGFGGHNAVLAFRRFGR
ncbi:MAG: beta-ketoacyl-ACP synthase II [Candidatus Sericytochromatia bacterium]